MRDERGWALISVLWVLSILAILAAAAQTLSYGSAQRERHALAGAQADALLDAAIVRAVVGITDPRPEHRWRVDGTPQVFEFEGHTVQVAVQDELGRIDLNAADGSLIKQLLLSVGVAKGTADVLTDRILDWRGSGDLQRLHGTNSSDYAMAGLTYRSRHGPFQSVAELRLVLGMTSEIFARLRPAVTVYSHHPAIDTKAAPRGVLLAYYPNQIAPLGSVTSSERGSVRFAGVADLTGHTFAISIVINNAGTGVRHHSYSLVLTNWPVRPILVAM